MKSFFKSSIEVALSEEKNLGKLKEIISPVENFTTMKRLSNDVAIYIGKKQRDRFYHVINKFTSKHEQLYAQLNKNSLQDSHLLAPP